MPDLRRRHRRTLERMRSVPTPADIRWAEIESLLLALDAELEERAGSRVAISIGDETVVMHKPHPRPVMQRPAVRRLVRFIERTGAE